MHGHRAKHFLLAIKTNRLRPKVTLMLLIQPERSNERNTERGGSDSHQLELIHHTDGYMKGIPRGTAAVNRTRFHGVEVQ